MRSHCDALSINLVVLSAFGAAGLTLTLRRGRSWPLDARLGVPAAFGAVGLVLYALAEPACLAGPFGQQDAAIGPIWLVHVTETKSLLWLAAGAPVVALAFAATTLLGLIAAWRLAVQPALPAQSGAALSGAPLSSALAGDGAKLTLAMLALAALLGLWQVKLLPYVSLLAVLPLACCIARLDNIQNVSPATARTIAVVLSSQLGIAVLAGPTLAKLAPADQATGQWLATARRCISTPAVAPLAALPPGLVFADMNLGPFIAALTPNRVVAAPYHRLDKAIIDTDRLMFGPSDAAMRRLRALGVDSVVICPGLTRPHGAKVSTDSLYTLLNADAAPSWLRPVALGDATPIRAWRVVRTAE